MDGNWNEWCRGTTEPDVGRKKGVLQTKLIRLSWELGRAGGGKENNKWQQSKQFLYDSHQVEHLSRLQAVCGCASIPLSPTADHLGKNTVVPGGDS